MLWSPVAPSSAMPFGAVENAISVPTGASSGASPAGVTPRNFRRRPSGPTITPPPNGFPRAGPEHELVQPVLYAAEPGEQLVDVGSLRCDLVFALRLDVDRQQVVAA